MDNINEILNSDLDFLIYLIDNGPKIFNYLLKNYNDVENRDKIINYLSIFLFEGIVENSVEQLFDILKDSNYDNIIWETAVKNFTEDKLLDIVERFILLADEISLDECILFFKKVFVIDEKVIDLFYSRNFWFFDKGSEFEKKSLLGTIINKIKLDNTWYMDIEKINQFIVDTFIDKSKLDFLIDWIAEIFNKNISKMNLDTSYNFLDTLSSDKFLINIFVLTLECWEVSKNLNQKVDGTYLIHKSCPIRWLTKKLDHDIQFNSNTKFFCLVLNGIRIVYAPIINRLNTWQHLIEELHAAKNQLWIMSLGLISQIELNAIDTEIKYAENTYELDCNIITYYKIDNRLLIFYNYFIEFIKEDEDLSFLEIDDILRDMIYILKNIDYIYNEKLAEFQFNVAGSKKYTKNIEIRYDFFCELSSQSEIDKEKFLETLFVFHNDLSTSKISNVTKYVRKVKLYKKILKIKNYEIIDKCFGKFYDNIKFASYLLEDACDIVDLMETFYEKITSNYISIGDYDSYVESLYNILYYQGEIIQFLESMITKVDSFKNVVLKEEIISGLSNFLKGYTMFWSKRLGFKTKFFDPKIINDTNIKLNERLIFHYIVRIIMMFKDNYTFMINLTEFEEKEYIKRLFFMNRGLDGTYLEIKESIKSFNEKNSHLNELSDEFLDPITCLPIIEPILLPDMKSVGDDIFFDKSTILKHLLIKEENPYTRESLTKEQLLEYNSRPDIVEKIENYKNKYKSNIYK